MAYIKIFGIKSTVKKAVEYITNPDKTDDQNLVSSYGCSPETADLEFAMTAKLGKRSSMLLMIFRRRSISGLLFSFLSPVFAKYESMFWLFSTLRLLRFLNNHAYE